VYATTKKAVVKKDVKSKVVAKKGYVEFKENGKGWEWKARTGITNAKCLFNSRQHRCT